MSAKDYILRIAAQLQRKREVNKSIVNSQRSQLPIDFAGTLNADKTKVTLPDGTEGKAQLSGTPAPIDATIQIGSDIYYVVNQAPRRIQVDGNKKGYLILKSTAVTAFKHKYFVQDIDDKDKVYEIDTYAIAGLPAPTNDTGDYVTFVGFSNKGNHILVGGVIENHLRDKPITLKWGILKNWRLKKDDPDNPEIEFVLEQGTKDINREDYDLAPDPGAPGPASVELVYERTQTGSGPGAECPWNNNQGTFGATLYNTKYEIKETKRYEVSVSDPRWVDLADPGADLNVIDSTYGFSEDELEQPIVDFGFSFTSTYRRFSLYNLTTEITEEYFKNMNDRFQIGCANHCLTTYTKKSKVTQTHQYGNVIYAIKDNEDYVGDPCFGFNEAGQSVDQTRSITTESEVELKCTRNGSGTGDFCINAEGECTDPAKHDFPIACPGGWPTCYYKMVLDCPIAPYPRHLTEEALPGCKGLPQFNYSMVENIIKGVIVTTKINTFGSGIIQRETGNKTKSNLLVTRFATRGACEIKILSWPGPFEASGTITISYWDREEQEEEEGDRFITIPRKLFRDVGGNTSILVTNTNTGFTEWWSPLLNTNQILGNYASIGQLGASDDKAFTAFTLDPDVNLIFPSASNEFRSFKILTSPNIEIKTWRKRPDDNYYPNERVRGKMATPANYTVEDFILK